jgi:hypothetical protein
LNSKRPLDDLSRLDPVLASLLLDEIEACAARPARHSRRPGLPFLPYQRFEITLTSAGEQHFFAVLFQYGQDEQTLHVRFIGHSIRG